jgi:hypothetical protein
VAPAAAVTSAPWNHARFLPGQRAGHYESFFQRANHPSRPLAFWIRYTLFSPGQDGLGELWAVFFDGEAGHGGGPAPHTPGAHVAVKREVPIALARFDRSAFSVRVDDARLGPGALAGAAASGDHRISWDLRYRGTEPPLLLFPEALYEARLPRAKSLVGLPLAVHEGTLVVDGRTVDVDGWVGSQNHNWGSRHTDHYAWGQVAGFDAHPGSFLEIATARLKVGPLWTPFMTPAVLRHRGREHAANGPAALARAKGSFEYFRWRFAFDAAEVHVEGHVSARAEDFVGLVYKNPPGGVKHCLNTKIATCELTVAYTSGPDRGRVDHLSAKRRAAFEILTDDQGHGVPILAGGAST